MARILKSPIGELSGKAGGLVFKTGKNGNYVSSLPVPTKKKPSAVQQLQRNKMTVVMEFLRPFQYLIKDNYFPFQQNKSGFHAAKSYYLKEAVVFQNGDYSINYPKALLSYGDLRGIKDLQIAVAANNEGFNLQWTDNCNQAMAYPNDQLLVVCYAPEAGGIRRSYYRKDLAQRADGEAFYPLGASNTSTEYHIWAGFCRPEEKRASPSMYAGSVTL